MVIIIISAISPTPELTTMVRLSSPSSPWASLSPSTEGDVGAGVDDFGDVSSVDDDAVEVLVVLDVVELVVEGVEEVVVAQVGAEI